MTNINLESHARYLVTLNTPMPLRVTLRSSYPTVVGQILNRMCIQNERNRNLQFKRNTSEFSLGWITKWNHVSPRSNDTTYLGTPKIRNIWKFCFHSSLSIDTNVFWKFIHCDKEKPLLIEIRFTSLNKIQIRQIIPFVRMPKLRMWQTKDILSFHVTQKTSSNNLKN